MIVMAEYIERKAAIAAVRHAWAKGLEPAQYVEEIPAADVVKRERGEWVFKFPNGWACSECGEWGLMRDNRGICKSNFCPHCGADMRPEGGAEG